LAPSETKEETAPRVRVADIRASTTVGTFARIKRKRRMMVVHWTDWHLMKELLGMSGLKEGAAGAFGREITVRTEPW
jgi:hypothetical protein